jgi:serine protease Do
MSHDRYLSHRRCITGAGIAGLLAGAAIVSLVGVAGHDLGFAQEQNTPPPAVAQANDLSAAFRYAAGQALPAVVTIRTTSAPAQQASGDGESLVPEGVPEELRPFFRRFFGGDREQFPRQMPRFPQAQGMGSGVIIDSSGLILTNNHVVGGGARVLVRLSDGREFEAVEVQTDPKTDVAILRIDGAGDLPVARLGDSDTLEIGDWVLAVGAPFGLQETVTAGIISAKSRGLGIAEREEFLQTDAAINPGNSGGPLVNLRGEVVGINTAISTRGGGNDGVGFAIPVNLAQWVSHQLAETGRVQRAFLGVGIQQVTSDLSRQFGLSAVQGAVVTEVRADSAATTAGLQPGDVIVEFNGRAVNSPRDLQNLVERAALDKAHQVTVIREGQRVTMDVTLQEMPATVADADGRKLPSAPQSEFEQLGLEVTELTSDVAGQLGLPGSAGVVITAVDPNGLAAAAGLREGLVIARVGRRPVASVAEFKEALGAADLSQGLLLLVQSPEGSRFFVLRQS